MRRFLLEPTNAQLDYYVAENEYLHLEFVRASGGKRQTGPVPAQPRQEVFENQMDCHHLLVRRVHSL